MDTKELINVIKAEIAKTENLILQYRDLAKPISPENAIGRVSRMDAINNKSINDLALRQNEEKLKNLKQVLEKAGSKDFGICLRCKTAIPIGRLMIRPESLYCVKCSG